MCLDGREFNELRFVFFYILYLKYSEGFVLILVGDIKVICIVSIDDRVFFFMCG